MKTERMELVETNNLARSLKRLTSGGGGYDDERWKRALYHALAMNGHGHNVLKRVREALELP